MDIPLILRHSSCLRDHHERDDRDVDDRDVDDRDGGVDDDEDKLDTGVPIFVWQALSAHSL